MRACGGIHEQELSLNHLQLEAVLEEMRGEGACRVNDGTREKCYMHFGLDDGAEHRQRRGARMGMSLSR